MSAAALIAEARAAGVRLHLVDGDRLRWTCATPPPADLLARLRENKPLLIRALEAIDHRVDGDHRDGDAEAQRWRDFYEERAAIREYDGGLSRADAEAAALDDLANMWRCENPLAPSDPRGPCVHCGAKMREADAISVLARGGHAWLHHACWRPLQDRLEQKAEAVVRVLLRPAPC